MNKHKLITKDFMLLFFFMVITTIGSNMLNVIVPLYVVGPLGSTTSVAGLMTTIYIASSCLSRPINNALTDRFGRQKVMLAGTALLALSVFISGIVPSIIIFSILRVFTGVSYSACTTACNTASTDIIPKDRLASGLGYFGMSQSVGNIFGPYIAAAVIAWASLHVSSISAQGTATVAVAIVFLAVFILSFFVRYEKRKGYTRPVAASNLSFKDKYFEKTALIPSVFEFFTLFFVSCIMCFITLYVAYIGLGEEVTGIFFLISSLIIVLIRAFLSHLMEKVQACILMIPGYIALIAACLLLPHVHTAAGIYGIAVLYGIEHGIVWMALGTEAVRKATPEKMGTANTTFYTAFDAAIGIGALVWGSLIDSVGYSTCFYIIAAGCAVLAVLSIFIFREKKNKI